MNTGSVLPRPWDESQGVAADGGAVRELAHATSGARMYVVWRLFCCYHVNQVFTAYNHDTPEHSSRGRATPLLRCVLYFRALNMLTTRIYKSAQLIEYLKLEFAADGVAEQRYESRGEAVEQAWGGLGGAWRLCGDNDPATPCPGRRHARTVRGVTHSPGHQRHRPCQTIKGGQGTSKLTRVGTPKMRLGGDMGPNMDTTINKIAYATNGRKLNNASKHILLKYTYRPYRP
ncbi:hypothetical protein E2C01_020362 [Portunus trituberculatus]|uniref:Uncharacterized protein n=1 Tax=Portunus trituberculatus TaxID=210409 RepID=A0A5B7E136_PORTR|nr:hypothetical protein [Portunus trituberculatus]